MEPTSDLFQNPLVASPDHNAILAAEDLQHYLSSTDDFEHDFGLGNDARHRGKMFGVLVARNQRGDLGYLSGYSGTLQGSNNLSRFVPSVYQDREEEERHNAGMRGLTALSRRIKELELSGSDLDQVEQLKQERKSNSRELQRRLFAHYEFLNSNGEVKNLLTIFSEAGLGIPPSAAGDCAAPRLLQYAFEKQYVPFSLTEFWWGKPRSEEGREHGQFYGPCKEKCEPILAYMLGH